MKLKKLKNLKFSFMSIVAFMAIMLITGCGDETTVGEKTGGSGSGAVQEAGYYDIVGTVVNDADDPIEHVFIDIIDFVMTDGGEEPFVASVRSDGNGEFGIRIPGENAVRQVTVRFTFQDCVTYVRDVAVTRNDEVDLETITLTVMSQKTIEDSTIENTLADNVRANAYVTIGADALRYSDGTTFTTVVAEDEDPITATVAIGYVDTTAAPGLFPDNLYSMVNGSLKLFSTYGILEIKVTTDGGNTKLSLGAGQTATISIPIGELVNVNDPDFPATVDLWYYDEDAAEWVLEQEDGLTYDAGTRSFTGVVSHFSAFNAGYTFESRYVQAAVIDDRGMTCPSEEYDEEDQCTVDEVPYLLPLPGSTVKIFTDTFSPYGVWNATYTAGSDGKIPDSMNPSIAGLLYHDEDGYFLPVPGIGNLMAFMEYTNPTTDEPGSEGPDLIEFEEGKASHDYLLSLSTSAYLAGSVEYEDGDETFPKRFFAIFEYDPESTDSPAAGGTFGGTISWIGITTDGKIDQFNSGVLEGTLLANAGAETTYAVANNDWFSTTTYQGGFSPAVDVYLGGNPVEKDPLFGYPLITTGKIGDVTNLRVVLPSPPGDVVYTHINGSIVIPDGVDDPTKLWVVVETTFNDRPITVRASVDADGNWPADDGTFNPFTVPGVEGLFIQVPAEADITITVGDYVTNPLTPKIYYTYDYTSLDEGEVGEDGTITTYTTDTFIPAPNATIDGQVTYNAELGADLRIVFTKENPGEDDTPVTVTTSGSGKFSANLEFDTDYIIEIWDDTDPLYPVSIYSDYYTSNPDGEVGYITDNTNDPVVVGLIQIGDEYIPAGFPYDPILPAGSTGLGGTLMDNAGDPIAVGTFLYLQLQGSTSYIWGIVGDEDGTFYAAPGYVSNGRPIELTPGSVYSIGTAGRTINAAFTAGQAGEVQIVNLTDPGEGGTPSNIAYITGALMDNAGDPIAVGTFLYLQLQGSTSYIWGIVGDEDGTFYAAPGYVSNGKPIELTPGSVYSIGTAGRTINAAFTAGQAGEVQTVNLTDPGEGGTPSNITYLTGFLTDNAGDPIAVGTFLYLQLQGSTSYIWGIVGDEDGTFYAAPGYVSNGKPIELTPGSVYSIGTAGRTINAAFTAGQAGEVQTVILTDPGE